jgi:hypothetical protein
MGMGEFQDFADFLDWAEAKPAPLHACEATLRDDGSVVCAKCNGLWSSRSIDWKVWCERAGRWVDPIKPEHMKN